MIRSATRTALAALACLGPCALAAPARASDVPVFDTPAYCRTTVTQQGPFMQEKYDYCLSTEHAARGMVSRHWGRMAQAELSDCTYVATSSRADAGHAGSYGVLVTCLEGKPDFDAIPAPDPRGRR